MWLKSASLALRIGGEGQKVSVRSNGERQLTFDEVVVRVCDDFALEFHIDTEEANAAGLKNGAQVTLIG